MNPSSQRRCIALLGGSFDPVHNGHVTLAEYITAQLRPDELRIIPTGNPWQKDNLQASAEHRVAMLECAFRERNIPFAIDLQEIQRHTATYSIDTLRAIRAEAGQNASLVFLMGADQLQQLHTWKDWQSLFDFAHICAVTRPGFSIEAPHMQQAVAQEYSRRAGSLEQIRTTPHGLTYLAPDLAVDVSSTAVRAACRRGSRPDALVPPAVLDYIEQHHLYQK